MRTLLAGLIFAMAATMLNSQCVAQATDITRSDFVRVISNSLDHVDKIPMRATLEQKTVSRGVEIERMVQVLEYDGPEKSRRKDSLWGDGSLVNSRELITIGSSQYCKIRTTWKRTTDPCNPMHMTLSAPDDFIVQRFTVSETELLGTKAKLYEHYQTFNRNGVMEYTAKLWIDGDGKRLRSETRAGLKDDKQKYRIEEENYEYRPNDLKISVPKDAIKATPE